MLPDRVQFAKRMEKVTDAMSMAQVRAILGNPDDILSKENSDVPAGTLYWGYGTSGHGSFPTLGQIRFTDGKVAAKGLRWSPPPPSTVISEAQLRDTLGKMAFLSNDDSSSLLCGDPAWVLRAANAIIPLGKTKALAVIEEFENLTYTVRGELDPNIFWLVRTAFEAPAYGEFSRFSPYAAPPTSPRFPFYLLDDVPLSSYRGSGGTGPSPRLYKELDYLKQSGVLRKSPLIPPDDPFIVIPRMLIAPEWPYKDARKDGATGEMVPDRYRQEVLMFNLILLVRPAFRATKGVSDGSVNAADFERLHQEFIATGTRWDRKLQRYVRRDGKDLGWGGLK